MARRIPLSFKENQRDIKLYNAVISEPDHSAFIKKAIEHYLENNQEPKRIVESKVADEIVDNVEDEMDILSIVSGKNAK